MADLPIVNAHIHSFTAAHVPVNYPHPLLRPFKTMPVLLLWIAWVLRLLGQAQRADTLVRLHRFQTEAQRRTQSEILDRARLHYPAGTRFVVLPMDLSMGGWGRPPATLEAQHDELAALAAARPDVVIPFASADPRRPGAGAFLRQRLLSRGSGGEGFAGLKLYPRLGYAPDHPVLMEEVYPLCIAHSLPVLTHCSRGGVIGRGVPLTQADAWSSPQAWEPVWARYPDLRVCLAHFGGMSEWRTYVDEGLDPDDPAARVANWQTAIRDMLASGRYPGLWTDISYTLFEFDDFIPFLKVFLEDERVAARVLFGSDFYMTRRERLSERAVCMRLRVALGENLFARIAVTNPRLWLGQGGTEAGPVNAAQA